MHFKLNRLFERSVGHNHKLLRLLQLYCEVANNRFRIRIAPGFVLWTVLGTQRAAHLSFGTINPSWEATRAKFLPHRQLLTV